MDEDDRDYLADMLEHAELAQELVASRTDREVIEDRHAFAALCYFMQTIGEAANQVSEDARSALTGIPWKQVIGMRHRIAHGYRSVASAIVISAARDDLPPVIVSLRRALEDPAP